MPPLTFHPEHERHLSLIAANHCLKHYDWVKRVRAGEIPDNAPGSSLLIGIGLDAGVGAWWATGDVESAVAAARKALFDEGSSVPSEVFPDYRAIEEEVVSGVRQYVRQWDGVRSWRVLHIHPYLQDPVPEWLVLHPSEIVNISYLSMPDMIVEMDGALLVVDQKTSVYPYRPENWAWDPQMLVNCLAAWSIRDGREVGFLVDYMQRPTRRSTKWVFPVTYPVPFDEDLQEMAYAWLQQGVEAIRRHEKAAVYGDEMRDPGACRTWYGYCEWRGRCFGTES